MPLPIVTPRTEITRLAEYINNIVPFYIDQAGTIGDGVFDNTSILQDVLNDSSIKALIISANKQYNISDTLLVPSDRFVLGLGYSSRIHMTVADKQMFLCQGTNNIGFMNFRLTGQGGFTTPGLGSIRLGLGSVGNGCDDSFVQNVWFDGVSNCGITIGSKSNRCSVINCKINGAGEEGIYLLASDCQLIGNISRNNGNAGIKCSSGINPLILGNTLSENVQQGLLIATATIGGLSVGNICFKNGFEGLTLNGSPKDHIVGFNNCHSNSQDSDNIRSNITVDGASIIDCTLIGNTCRQGVEVNKPKYGMELKSGSNLSVINNDLRGGGKTGDFLDTGTNTSILSSSAGGVSIGSISPNAKAILDMVSTTRGFLPPRMTSTQRDAITSPPAGLMIYNTTTNKSQTFNGTTWNDHY